MSRTLILVVSQTALGVFQETVAQSKSSFDGFKLVDKTGNIRKPDDYRDRYQMLGAYMVLDQKGNQMHDTYASPRSRRVLPSQSEVRRWHCIGEGDPWNGSRAP
jgi:hypothetical protein